MPRITRIVLAALFGLGVIVAVFASAEGVSFAAQNNKIGSHLVSGPMVNLDHFRVANPAPASMQPELQSGKGYGCESNRHASPDD